MFGLLLEDWNLAIVHTTHYRECNVSLMFIPNLAVFLFTSLGLTMIFNSRFAVMLGIYFAPYNICVLKFANGSKKCNRRDVQNSYNITCL